MTVTEAAAVLGVTPRAVQRRIKNGEMAAEWFGPVLAIPESEVNRWKPVGKRKGGRPRKAPTTTELRRDQAEHQAAIDQGRQRIRGEEGDHPTIAEEGQPS